MTRNFCCIALCASLLIVSGCASAPEMVYVTEAQQVTTMALEPVNLDDIGLKNDLNNKFSDLLSPELSTELMNDIQAQLANTRRFTRVLMNASDQETYIIEPRIESLSFFEAPLNMDPTRKQVTFKARVRLDVKFMNNKGQIELVKSFSDDRRLESKIPKKIYWISSGSRTSSSGLLQWASGPPLTAWVPISIPAMRWGLSNASTGGSPTCRSTPANCARCPKSSRLLR